MKRRDLLIAAALSPVASLAMASPNTTLEALAEIGRRALQKGLVPKQTALLQQTLGLQNAKLSEQTGLLNNKVARDFETGDTLQIDGWVVSKTEACVCALVALKGEDA